MTHNEGVIVVVVCLLACSPDEEEGGSHTGEQTHDASAHARMNKQKHKQSRIHTHAHTRTHARMHAHANTHAHLMSARHASYDIVLSRREEPTPMITSPCCMPAQVCHVQLQRQVVCCSKQAAWRAQCAVYLLADWRRRIVCSALEVQSAHG